MVKNRFWLEPQLSRQNNVLFSSKFISPFIPGFNNRLRKLVDTNRREKYIVERRDLYTRSRWDDNMSTQTTGVD